MNGRGTNDNRALRCSTPELRSVPLRQDSNLRQPAPEAKYLLSTPPAKVDFGDGTHHQGIGEKSFRVRALRYRMLGEYAQFRNARHSGRVSGPAFFVEEVTLFYRHW